MIFSLGNWYSEKDSFWKVSTLEAVTMKIRIYAQGFIYILKELHIKGILCLLFL